MNPWTALLEPTHTLPPPAIRSRRHSADGYTIRPAAALVVTYLPGDAVPVVELLPIVAVDFSA
jgi:hypothetical protein